MPDINFAKFNIPIKIVKAFDQGKIDKLYQGIYTVADKLSSADANRFLKKAVTASISAIEKSVKIARRMTNIELSNYAPFMNEFVAALFLPHTDAKLFPSVNYTRQ